MVSRFTIFSSTIIPDILSSYSHPDIAFISRIHLFCGWDAIFYCDLTVTWGGWMAGGDDDDHPSVNHKGATQ